MHEAEEAAIQIEKQRITYAEMGNSGLQRAGDFVDEEFLPQLQFPQAAKVYQEMSSNDPVIGGVLYMSEQLIRKAGWSVEAGGKTNNDKKAAKFLEECMDDMTMSWNNTISEILSMLSYGFSFHEVVYKIRGGPDAPNSKFRSKYNDGRIGWRRMPIRAQSSLYGWEFADDGDVKAYIQMPPPHYRRITIPMNKGVLFRTKIAKDNPEGLSLLRSAYRPWYFKKKIEEIEGIGIERDLAGLPVITAPEGVNIWDKTDTRAIELRTAAESLVRNIRRDQLEGLVLQYGWDFQLVSTGGSRQFDTSAIINRYDHRIAMSMLSDIVLMGGDKVGSFALGEVKKSLLAASLEAQIQNIADTLNKYAVPQLFSLNNFGKLTALPKIKPGEVETPDLKELAFLLRAAGFDVRKDLELMNLLRRMISVDPLEQEEFQRIYGEINADGTTAVNPDSANRPKGVSGDSQNTDPVGHMITDGDNNFEGTNA